MLKNIKKLHERFTSESNTVIKIDELVNILASLDKTEQNDILISMLNLSEENNAVYTQENKDFADFFAKRETEPVVKNKKRVIASKKMSSRQKDYICKEIEKYEQEIKKAVALSLDEFDEYVFTSKKEDVNFIILGLMKELKFFQDLADEAFLNKDAELLEDIKKNTFELEEKIEVLKEYREEIEVPDEEKCNIIFFETFSKRSYFKEDVEGYSSHYTSFAKILRSLQNGKPLGFKRFVNNNFLSGVTEARDVRGQTRVFFEKVDSNTYVIINSIVKKSDNDVGYITQLEKRYKIYLQAKNEILKSLNNNEFRERQAKHLAEAEEMLAKAKNKRR